MQSGNATDSREGSCRPNLARGRFGSSNRVKKQKKQARVTGETSRLHHAGLSMKVLSRRNTAT